MKVPAGPNSPAPARILLVDDNKMGLSARRSLLEELGHRATIASSGEEALGYFAPAKFDLVITDYKMPKMNGVELIERVRKIEPAIPIILISGYVETVGLHEKNTGADVVIPKSNNEVEHLVRSVTKLLRKQVPRKPPVALKAQVKSKRKSV